MKKRIEGLDERENIDVIFKFLDSLFAEGLSRPRVLKYSTHLKVISERMGKPFREVDKEDIIRYLSKLEQSSYSPQTKRDYRVVLRRFFTFLGKEDLIRDHGK